VFRQLQSAAATGNAGDRRKLRKNPHCASPLGHPPVDAAASLLHRSEGNLAVDALSDASCLCPKQFKRKFHERNGINPKTYARIIRFTNAYNIRNRFPDKDWLTIATQCGYYDYQHLVKDYKDFTGAAPTAFHLLESNSPESVLGLSQEVYRSRLDSIR
jgi:transcriptional regulator GlxA family with amidase domain